MQQMKQRVIRREADGHWRIQTKDFEAVSEEEQRKLRDYFSEIRLSFHEIGGEGRIDGSMEWSDVDERMKHFYDGWAEFTPF